MTDLREDVRTRPPVPSFSVVLPCFNAESTIAEVLEALTAMDPPAEEIIVVDDFSGDASREICRRYPITLIEQDEHGGVSVTRNRGAQAASGDVLLFVDSDIVVPPDLLESLVEAHRDQPDYVGFSVLPDPDFHRGGFFSEYLNRRMHNGFSHLRSGVTTLCTSCASVWRDVFTNAGGFDRAGTYAVNDEATLGWRLAESGQETAVLDGIYVRHLKVMSLGAWSHKFFHEGRQWVVLVGRHRNRHRTGASAKLTLQFRRPLNVVLMAAGAASEGVALIFGSIAIPLLAILTLIFVVLNLPYLAAMSRGKGLVWSGAAVLMVLLEAALHLFGLFVGALARVMPG